MPISKFLSVFKFKLGTENEMYKIDELKKVSAYILILKYAVDIKFRFLL